MGSRHQVRACSGFGRVSRALTGCVAVLVFAAAAVSFRAVAGEPAYDDQYYADENAPQAAPARDPVIIPVPRVTIYPGDVINDDMLANREMTTAEAPHLVAMFAGRDGLVGKVSRQTLLPNAPVPKSAVREPFAVKLGQPAVVVFQSGALVISGTAVPLQAGAIGEVIALRNTESGTTIRGVVQSDGTIRVGGP